jgi:hypothetical protein
MKLLQWVKEIRSKTGRLHFKRFAIIETKNFALYIHRIYEHDRDIHLHTHPWNFKTVVLSGGYVEQYLGKDLFCEPQEFTRVRRPFSYASGDRNYYHKILEITNGPVTTLFFTFGRHQPWYYSVGDTQIESEEYRRLKHEGKL